MLSSQRRRWQLGLMQTVMKHDHMLMNPRYGWMGMVSMPFHAYVEPSAAWWKQWEPSDPLLLPDRAMPLSMFFMLMSWRSAMARCFDRLPCCYLRSTIRRYPTFESMILVGYAFVETWLQALTTSTVHKA